MLNIYKLTRDLTGYDETYDLIVAAHSEADARDLAETNGTEGDWRTKATCQCVGYADPSIDEPTVLCEAIRHG